MNKLWRNLRGWIITFAVLAGGYAILHFVVLAPKPIPVRIHKIGTGLVERTVTNTKAGAVRSRRSANVSPERAGTITEILHREGSEVKAGDALVKLDDRTVKASIAVAEKNLVSGHALELQAKESAAEAVREFKRLDQLKDEGTVSEAEWDRADSQVRITSAALTAATARVAELDAMLAQSKLELDKLIVRAPFDGIVAELKVEIGESAAPSLPLLRLIDPNDIYIRSELDEVDIGKVTADLPVRVTLDPYKGRTFEGSVIRVAPHVSEVREQARTVEIEVKLTGGIDGVEMKPGTSADVEVILEKIDDTLRVPTLAVMEGGKVLIVREGVAVAVKIETGLRNWDYTQVLKGLSPGDPVIVSLDKKDVKEGAKVVVEEAE